MMPDPDRVDPTPEELDETTVGPEQGIGTTKRAANPLFTIVAAAAAPWNSGHGRLKEFLLQQDAYLPFGIALAIAIVVSACTYHTDFWYLTAIANRTAAGNLNLYQPMSFSTQTATFSMPPLIGFVDAFFYMALKTLGILNFDFHYGIDERIPNLQVLLLKSRYILVFALSYPLVKGAALHLTARNRELSRAIANIWITSPILLTLPFAQGNNDIYPAVMSLVFLFFAFKGNNFWAMTFLGLTAALKNYGVFLILPAAIILSGKEARTACVYCAVAATFYILPSIICTHGFSTVGASPKPNGITESLLMLKTTIPSYHDYSIFVTAYCLIVIFLFYNDNAQELRDNRSKMLVKYCFLVLSLFFVTFYIPQWFLWILPFFTFIVYENKRLFYLYLLICLGFYVGLFTTWPSNLDACLWKGLTSELFANPDFFPVVPTNDTLVKVSGSVFIALFIGFIYYLLTDRKAYPEPPGREAPYRSLGLMLSYLLVIAILCQIALTRA